MFGKTDQRTTGSGVLAKVVIISHSAHAIIFIWVRKILHLSLREYKSYFEVSKQITHKMVMMRRVTKLYIYTITPHHFSLDNGVS